MLHNYLLLVLQWYTNAALSWGELSLTILYLILMEESFHNHMPQIFSYLKTRTKRLCHLRRDYTVICTKSSVSFSYFAFWNIPNVHCMLSFALKSRQIEIFQTFIGRHPILILYYCANPEDHHGPFFATDHKLNCSLEIRVRHSESLSEIKFLLIPPTLFGHESFSKGKIIEEARPKTVMCQS